MKGRPISWNAAELAFIKRGRKKPRRDLHAEFVKKFRRRNVTLAALASLCKRSGWLTGPRKGRGKGRSTAYSKAELAFIRRRGKLPRRKLYAAFVAAFGRTDMSLTAFKATCKRYGVMTGRNGCFVKGAVPANKGKRMPYNPNSARTQFKKGQHPRNTKFAGHEYINSDGYVEISIEETNPHTGFERRYVHKHRLLWEKAHGPIPDDHVLKCKGDRSNPDPSNWELIPRAMLPRLNGRHTTAYDDAPTELKPTIMAVAKLEHQLREKRRAER